MTDLSKYYTKEEIETFTDDLLHQLMKDGTSKTSEYIFYHVVTSVSQDGKDLESFLVEAIANNFDVFDPEHISREEIIEDDEDQSWKEYKFEIPQHGIFTTDVLVSGLLDKKQIVEDALLIQSLAEKHGVYYQLWGTYIEDDDSLDEETPTVFND